METGFDADNLSEEALRMLQVVEQQEQEQERRLNAPVAGKIVYRRLCTKDMALRCQICLGDFKHGDVGNGYVIQTPCVPPNSNADPHVFCDMCLEQWLETNRNCPTCRKVIDKNHRELPPDHPEHEREAFWSLMMEDG
jgi:hypothetical protein